MVPWTTFIDVYGRPIDTLSLEVTYQHTFESAYPKHKPSNGSNKAKLLHDTIEVRENAHVCKLNPSCST
jgi:molybdenum cofactor biosynthesis enzyme MoaA